MKQFTEKDLVDFGNQLLSKEREVLHEINLHQVTDADLDSFYNIKGYEPEVYKAQKDFDARIESLNNFLH